MGPAQLGPGCALPTLPPQDLGCHAGIQRLSEIAGCCEAYSTTAGAVRTSVSFQHVVLSMLSLVTQPAILASMLKQLSNQVYQARPGLPLPQRRLILALRGIDLLQVLAQSPGFLEKTAMCLRTMVAESCLQDRVFVQVRQLLLSRASYPGWL